MQCEPTQGEPRRRSGQGDHVQYRRMPDIPGLVISTARFSEFSFERHYHLDCHIALVAEGVQRQCFSGNAMLLARGSIQLLPPGEIHDGIAGADGAYTLRTFRLAPDLLQGLGEDITGTPNFPAQAASMLQDSRLAEQLIKLHLTLQGGLADPLYTDTQVLDLLASLLARLRQPAPLAIDGKLSWQQLRQVRAYMEDHIGDKVRLEDLAAMLGIDRFRFLKLFKHSVGMTPYAWLLRLRLERAVQLINSNGGMTIAAIAQAVGFFDQSHFNRAFRSAYGVAPTSF